MLKTAVSNPVSRTLFEAGRSALAAALLAAFVAAIWSWRAFGRSKAEAETAGSGQKRGAIRLAVMAAAAVGGWMAGTLLQWLLWGRRQAVRSLRRSMKQLPSAGATSMTASDLTL